MKRKILVFTTLIIFLFASCYFPFSEKPLGDSRFNGYFSYYRESGSPSDFDYYEFRETWSFDGTIKAYHSSSGESFTHSGYDHWDFDFWYEIEVSNGKFRHKLWDNSIDEWSEWQKYEFLENGNLRIYEEDNTYKDFVKVVV